jgi:SpoVK/Ycf46/Vps4 family AAA+-type ATPase
MGQQADLPSVRNLLHELGRMDLLLRQAVRRLRAAQPDGPLEFRGLYVPDADVDTMLSGGYPIAPGFRSPRNGGEETLTGGVRERGVELRLRTLADCAGLTELDIDLVLVCLAPELDLRYERLYAYLQDDVTRKRPSVDLALNLLCPSQEAKLSARQRLAPSAPLARHGILQLFDDPSQPQPPLLSKYLKVDERVVSYLLGSDELDARLAPFARFIQPRARMDELLLPADLKGRLAALPARGREGNDFGTILYLQGPYGVGKLTAAEAVCRELGKAVLVIAGERVLAPDAATFDAVLLQARREALLRGAAIYWDGFDALLADDRRVQRDALLEALAEGTGISFLAGSAAWDPVDTLRDLPFLRVVFPRPSNAERRRLWTRSLDGVALGSWSSVDLDSLAGKFRLSGGQIWDATATARNLARWRDPDRGQVTAADLAEACRLHSNHRLAALAPKITPRRSWEDIVLPADRLEQLREICNVVRYRPVVYEQWGFERRLSLGKGLNVLFAGPSGTGKTLAAEILAGELGLDLYKIDLSMVVSKYIGETEKNLARIFAEAETSNAILFFDEADALFGQRSEVRDAHDRYANIEIGFLLQRMEEHEGIVILATNLRKNMDDAFVRRMQFAVEFPFPAAPDRRAIWERMWPDAVPRSPDLDLDLLASHLELAGGNIRNIALAAAFLAAAEREAVSMAHMARATRREYQKLGRVLVEEALPGATDAHR